MGLFRTPTTPTTPTPTSAPTSARADLPAQKGPDPLAACPHCGRRCRVPVTRFMPECVRDAYDRAGWEFMSTCEDGAAEEFGLLGASYADVIVERLGRVGMGMAGERARTIAQAQVLREIASESRRTTVRNRAENDQLLARLRETVEEASRRLAGERSRQAGQRGPGAA